MPLQPRMVPTTRLIEVGGRFAIVMVATDTNEPADACSIVVGGGLTESEAFDNALRFSAALAESIWRTRKEFNDL